MITHEILKSKYLGCMLGAAIGDALGKQNEGLKRHDILKRDYVTDYGKSPQGCPGEHLKPGEYTDDTEQMLLLAMSLVECNGFNSDYFAKRLARWGEDTMKDPLRKNLIGPSSSAAIKKLNSGAGWREAGSDIPSCGSAMRVAPIGLFYDALDEVEEKAALSSLPTHKSNAAIAGAVAVAVAVRCAVSGMDCNGIINEASIRASKYDIDIGEKIGSSYMKRDSEPDDAFGWLGTSYLVNETVPSAFYCFSRHSGNPEKAITEAVNAGGDTDSIACITGALSGAVHGALALPDRWVRGLLNRETVERVAEMVFVKAEKERL
ncbi:MAG: ADP-ribosylglycohydrolase family protein [Candidatus Methanoperedenaceae archaeon]|nr:ADP-ribosylglycohydrolase family protein [Candidatus Methanoperedenaceae archaeon]